jgi:hypothetical protein
MTSRLEKLAASPTATWEQLFELIEKGDQYAQIVAKNPVADSFLLRTAYQALKVEGHTIFAACTVLHNVNVESDFISEIYSDFPDIHTEEDDDYPNENCYPVLLAKHHATPFELVLKLSDSPYYLVRECLAARSDLLPTVEKKLVQDPIRHVRQILASNSEICAASLGHLAKDEDATIRMKVALHSNATSQTLQLLKSDPVELVRIAAQSANGG